MQLLPGTRSFITRPAGRAEKGGGRLEAVWRRVGCTGFDFFFSVQSEMRNTHIPPPKLNLNLRHIYCLRFLIFGAVFLSVWLQSLKKYQYDLKERKKFVKFKKV
jgi:hypothetical protein